MSAGRAYEDGFTMVELVVCLGLLALLAALIAQALSLASYAGAVLSRMERQDDLRAVQMHLRRALERAVPLTETESGATRLAFHGYPDRLRFAVRSDGRLEGGGLTMVEFRTEDRDGALVLVTEREALSGSGPNSSRSQSYELLEKVSGIALRYFGRGVEQSPPAWSAEWTRPDALPQLVEITVSGTGETIPAVPVTVAISSAQRVR